MNEISVWDMKPGVWYYVMSLKSIIKAIEIVRVIEVDNNRMTGESVQILQGSRKVGEEWNMTFQGLDGSWAFYEFEGRVEDIRKNYPEEFI